MAPGDPVEEIVTVSGGSTATVSVPSGETWILSGFALAGGSNQTRLQRTDGTVFSSGSVVGGDSQNVSMRPVYDTHDVAINNPSCSSRDAGFSGRQA